VVEALESTTAERAPDAPDAPEAEEPPPAPPDPRWARPALVALLVGTAVLYLWDLDRSGWANGYYAAAARAGATSWKAFFFGSLDSANGITVDKTPGFLWPMSLSVRLFGATSWSVLAPQALMGVGAVALLYLAVKRWFGAVAGLLAGLVLAVTPAAALMFRYDNPDALMVLLLVLAAYALVRALDSPSTGWLVVVGAAIGGAFMAKMLQAFVVVPGFGLVYLLAAPTAIRRRLLQLLAAGAVLFATAFTWVAVVMAIPAADRPYIGGSDGNSLWNVIFGFNGLGRLTGDTKVSTAGSTGTPSIDRLFAAEMGDYASWLLIGAAVLVVFAVLLTWRRAEGRRTFVAVGVFGTWLVSMGLTISLSEGIIHGYYTVAIAPPLAALVGIGAVTLWRKRAETAARVGLALALAATVVWSVVLLHRAPHWHPGLATAVLVVGIAVVVLLAVGAPRAGRLVAVVVYLAVVVGLAGSFAWSLSTVARGHTGAVPVPGPPEVKRTGIGALANAPAGSPIAQFTGRLIDISHPSPELQALLRKDAGRYQWTAATILGQQAAGYELATGLPVLALGGHVGVDPYPTLDQFIAMVHHHRIHWFIPNFPVPVSPDATSGEPSADILQYVMQGFASKQVGDTTVFDLTRPRHVDLTNPATSPPSSSSSP
jgi:4-amino-4-deoxy-L-arabinose transferase-like glycosyltransferase